AWAPSLASSTSRMPLLARSWRTMRRIAAWSSTIITFNPTPMPTIAPPTWRLIPLGFTDAITASTICSDGEYGHTDVCRQNKIVVANSIYAADRMQEKYRKYERRIFIGICDAADELIVRRCATNRDVRVNAKKGNRRVSTESAAVGGQYAVAIRLPVKPP